MAVPSRRPTGNVVLAAEPAAHWLPPGNYVSQKAPRGPLPSGCPAQPCPAQSLPAAHAAAWGVWNVRRRPARAAGAGRAPPGQRVRRGSRAMQRAAAGRQCKRNANAVRCDATRRVATSHSAARRNAAQRGTVQPVQCGEDGTSRPSRGIGGMERRTPPAARAAARKAMGPRDHSRAVGRTTASSVPPVPPQAPPLPGSRQRELPQGAAWFAEAARRRGERRLRLQPRSQPPAVPVGGSHQPVTCCRSSTAFRPGRV